MQYTIIDPEEAMPHSYLESAASHVAKSIEWEYDTFAFTSDSPGYSRRVPAKFCECVAVDLAAAIEDHIDHAVPGETIEAEGSYPDEMAYIEVRCVGWAVLDKGGRVIDGARVVALVEASSE